MRASSIRNLQRSVTIATLYWGACLVLVTLEAAVGANPVSALLFFLSVPMLVTALFWANRSLLRSRPRLLALGALGGTVLVYSSLILLLGLIAASKLKSLLT
jgi:hypothetical protein